MLELLELQRRQNHAHSHGSRKVVSRENHWRGAGHVADLWFPSQELLFWEVAICEHWPLCRLSQTPQLTSGSHRHRGGQGTRSGALYVKCGLPVEPHWSLLIGWWPAALAPAEAKTKPAAETQAKPAVQPTPRNRYHDLEYATAHSSVEALILQWKLWRFLCQGENSNTKLLLLHATGSTATTAVLWSNDWPDLVLTGYLDHYTRFPCG